MKCSKCGTEFEGNFCPECGEPIRNREIFNQQTAQKPSNNQQQVNEQKVNRQQVNQPAAKKPAAQKPVTNNQTPTNQQVNTAAAQEPVADKQKVNEAKSSQPVTAEPKVSSTPVSNNTVSDTNVPNQQNKKKAKKPIYKRWWFWLLVIIFAFGLFRSCNNGSSVEIVNFEWSDIKMSDYLPEPPSTTGEIHWNSKKELYISVYNVNSDQYDEYLSACKEMGYTVDSDEDSSMYEAFNEDGYALDLTYYDNELNITLDAPMTTKTITWPTSDAAKTVPTPKSLNGNIGYDSSNEFLIYIADTTKDDYNDYVQACIDAGYTVNYDKGDDYYYAKNADGYDLSLKYEGANVMSIQVEAPKDKSSKSSSSSKTTKSSTSSKTSKSSSATAKISDNKYKNLNTFVKKYNNYAKTPIKNLKKIDIQSPKYYRVEYRLDAFQNAPAYKGKIGEYDIEIVNEVVNFSDEILYDGGLRIYIDVNKVKEAKDIIKSFCKATDEDVTQEDIDDFYKYHTLGKGYENIMIGSVSGYCDGKKKLELFLSVSPDYFEESL